MPTSLGVATVGFFGIRSDPKHTGELGSTASLQGAVGWDPETFHLGGCSGANFRCSNVKPPTQREKSFKNPQGFWFFVGF